MDADTRDAMNSACEFVIREASGGWIVQYMEGWYEQDDGTAVCSREAVFTDEDTLSEWLKHRFKDLKRYRTDQALKPDDEFKTYIGFGTKEN